MPRMYPDRSIVGADQTKPGAIQIGPAGESAIVLQFTKTIEEKRDPMVEGDRWGQFDTRANDAVGAAKRAAVAAGKAVEQARLGNVSGVRNAVETLAGARDALNRTIEGLDVHLDEISSISSDPTAIAADVERQLLSLNMPGLRIWRSGPEVIAHPIITRIERHGDAARATVGCEILKTQRPNVIVDAILAHVGREFRADKFARSLYRAFQAIHPQEPTGPVELDLLFNVLAATAPGADRYTSLEFTFHLQRLHSSKRDEAIPGVTFRFHTVAASPTARRIVLDTRESVNIGSISFERKGTLL